MLSLTLVLGLAVAQTPDDLDVFRTDPKANILFLLDSSCSMGPSFGLLPTGCTWFAANYNGGNTNLSKQQMMKAALIGCTSADDGILDRWASKLNVSIHHFGGTVARLAPFNSTLSALETAVRGVPATGGTPMTSGLRSAGAYFRTAFTDATHPSCRKDYVVLMSDGEPNGGSATFNYDCGSPVETLAVSANEPWWGARYLYRRPNAPITPRDLLCTVTGVQPIRTYTVGFEALDTFDESNLQNIASYGDGSYFHATDVSELTRSFEGILSNIISRSHVDYSSPTTQTTGLFADNYAYSAYFRPIAGPWIGTLKKFCIEPRRTSTGLYDTSQTNCLYTSADGTTLFTNPAPQDLFTFIASANADRGGTGEVLFSVLGAGPNGAPVAPYWSHRNIVTWRDGTGWVPVDPAHLSRADTWANGCEHFRLINHLHGYSFDADCNTGAPVQVRDWPMGAPIHANPVLLKYGPCHDASDAAVPGVCFVAQATNDGMLHLFDAATGRETSAIVPAELWALGRVAKNRLERIMDQPTATVVQRYFVDGALRLFHDDLDGDTIIDDGEPARLVFGLGRGGSAYHQLDVGRLDDGVVTTDENPLYPLVATRGTALEELRETWHAPYVGRAVVAGERRAIAAFGSGHVAQLDDPAATLGTAPAGLQPPRLSGETRVAACTGAGGLAAANGYEAGGSTLCTVAYRAACAGTRASPCYDTGYWTTDPAAPLPLSLQFGPLRFGTATERGAAFRLRFDRFDLGSGDVLTIKDGRNVVAAEYRGRDLDGGGWTEWVYDTEDLGFYVELETDGVDGPNAGIMIGAVEWRVATKESVVATVPAHNPTLFVVDVNRWNGPTPQAFAAAPQSGAALLRVARSCPNADTGTCLDAARFPILSQLVCPITAEVSAYTEGDVVRSIYFATECGEIWKVWTPDGGTSWSVRRLLTTNTPNRTSVSKNFRKIFRRLDVVPSSCPGRRVVGLYFGTGNEQRPQAIDELTDVALNDGRDVVGVLWDDGSIDDLRMTSLEDVTNAAHGSVSPRTSWASGRRGWYVRLAANERMLRNPLVFDGVAYFKTRQPATGTTECVAGSGTDRVYAMDSCDADALGDTDGNGVTSAADRQRWSGTTDVGSELFLFTPRDGPPIVSVGDVQTSVSARLNPVEGRGVARYYMWRRPLRDP